MSEPARADLIATLAEFFRSTGEPHSVLPDEIEVEGWVNLGELATVIIERFGRSSTYIRYPEWVIVIGHPVQGDDQVLPGLFETPEEASQAAGLSGCQRVRALGGFVRIDRITALTLSTTPTDGPRS